MTTPLWQAVVMIAAERFGNYGDTLPALFCVSG